jgi:hypothetical protein
VINFNCKCHYCRNVGYVWRLLPSSTVWIEVPKNGSSGLKATLCRTKKLIPINNTCFFPRVFKTIRSPVNDLSQFTNGMIVLRDPVDRFRSLLSHYFIYEKGHRKHIGTLWLRGIKVNNQNICDVVLSDFDRLKDIGSVHHFNSQVAFIPDTFFLLSNIDFIDINDLSRRDVPHIGRSDSNGVVISDKNRKIIEELYHEDVVLYNERILK